MPVSTVVHTVPEKQQVCTSVSLDEWLDDLEIERSAIIMRLRQIDKRLMANDRLKHNHVPGHYVDRKR